MCRAMGGSSNRSSSRGSAAVNICWCVGAIYISQVLVIASDLESLLPWAVGTEVERRNGSLLAWSEFEADYLAKSKPLVLTGMADGWDAPTSWQSKKHFAATYGHARRQVRWPGGGNQIGILARETTVREYLEEMGTAAAKGREGLMFDRQLGLHSNVSNARDGAGPSPGPVPAWAIPPLFARAGMTDPIVSIGPAGAGLPFHNHASAWQTTVVGRKAFLLLPPLHRSPPPNSTGGESALSWLRPEPWFIDLLAKVFLPPTEAVLRDGHAQELWRRVVRSNACPTSAQTAPKPHPNLTPARHRSTSFCPAPF
jgi:hypothetical protein